MVKRKTSSAEVVLNEWLPAFFIGCTEAGKGDYGEMLRWRFAVPSPDGSELWVRSVLTSDKWTKRAKAWTLYAGMTGEAFSDDVAINTDVMNGAPFEIMNQLNREDKPTIALVKPSKHGEKLKPAVVKALNADEDARWAEEEGKDDAHPF
jgi:hypothetical protein